MTPTSSAAGGHEQLTDYRVKGSLLPGAVPVVTPPKAPSNPLDITPASPSQIYLNLLILEASFRSQYLNHLARRRKFTFFLVLLFIWIAFFCHRLFVLGGSPYYYVSVGEKMGLGGGVITGVLFYATGLYHETIVEPRQFVSNANRGLRGFNLKLVKQPLSSREWVFWWWRWYTFRPPPPRRQPPPPRRRPSATMKRPVQPLSTHTSKPPVSSLAPGRPSSQVVEEEDGEVEECLPGGLHIKLVILPKGFSPDFREGWELYRTEYWDKENESRQLRLEQLRTRPAEIPPTEERVRRRSRAGSTASLHGRSLTPERDGVPIGRTRRGSTASLKRRSIVGPPRTGTPGDVSDSGSTASAVGERDRTRRSESARSDRSSSSTGSTLVEHSRKVSGMGRGRKRGGKTSGVSSGDTSGSVDASDLELLARHDD